MKNFLQKIAWSKLQIHYIPATASLAGVGLIVVAVMVVANPTKPRPLITSADSQVLTASPNPISVCDNSGVGNTAFSWTVASGTNVELRKDGQTGQLLYQGTGSGTFQGTNIANNSNFKLYGLVTTTYYSWRYVRGRGWVREPVTTTQRQLLGSTVVTHTQAGCGVSSSALVVSVNPGVVAPGGTYVLTATQGTQNFSGQLDYLVRVCQLSAPTQCAPEATGVWNAVDNGQAVVTLPASFATGIYNARFRPHGQSNIPWSNETIVRVEASTNIVPPGGGTTTSNININNIRSVTYWDSIGNPQRDRANFLGCSSTFTSELEAQVAKMKDAGFNSVWLISWWYCFLQQGASPNMQFDAQAFVRLRETLDMLKRNNMKAELSLTYTAGIPGTNVSWCDLLTYRDAQGNPVGYWTIRDYVTRMMTELQNYNNDVVFLVHTEGLVCGTDVFKTVSAANAELVRSTVGRLPWDLPSNLRQKFIIGFHDYLENISGNGTGEVSAVTATMPKAANGSIPYDFKSMGYYDPTMYQSGNYSIYDLDERIQKLQDYYGQNLKVFMGELGSGICYYSYNPQVAAMNLRSMVSHVIGKGRGINVWEWIGHDCSVVDSDFKLNDTNGNPLPTLNAIKSLLNP